MQWEPIIAASVTGALALIGVINTDEHLDNALKLDRIEDKVDRTAARVETVSDRLDDHIVLHRMTTRKSWWRK